MKILAVDDDDCIRELIPMISAKAGYPDVTVVQSAQLALDALESAQDAFECFLFDIQMPGMDGIELCERVRAIPAYRKTPIIMLTAMTERNYIDKAFKAGATDYATKPFDITELGARLRMAEELVIARQQAAAQDGTGNAGRSAPERRHTLDPSDDVQIEGIKDLIDYKSFKAYLTQLSRAGLESSQVLAIKIDGIEAIHARASSEEFLYALTEVADAISEVLKTSQHMMAYAGSGTFVVISGKTGLETSSGTETAIQYQLDDKNSEYDNGDPLDIEVSAGNPMRPNASDTEGVQKTIDRAIARAETRSVEKKNAPRPVNIRLIGGHRR